MPNFVVQFGISANTSKTKRWDSAPLPDERSVMSSVAGTVAFAQSGSNSRSSQIFVNLRDNLYLDELGFAPFAVVTSGMHVVRTLFSDYAEQPMSHYEEMLAGGNPWMEKNFPSLSAVQSAQVFGEQQVTVDLHQEKNATLMLQKFKAGQVEPELIKRNMIELQNYLADPSLVDKLEGELLEVIKNPMKLAQTFQMMDRIKKLMAEPTTVQQVMGMINNPAFSDLMSPIRQRIGTLLDAPGVVQTVKDVKNDVEQHIISLAQASQASSMEPSAMAQAASSIHSNPPTGLENRRLTNPYAMHMPMLPFTGFNAWGRMPFTGFYAQHPPAVHMAQHPPVMGAY